MRNRMSPRSTFMMVLMVYSFAAAVPGAPPAAPFARLQPIPWSQVAFDSGFWAARIEVSRTRTIPYCLDMCEKTGRIRNFAVAAGIDKGPFRGHIFHDSDVYKVLEGAAYAIRVHPDAALERRLREVVSLVIRAQQPDGYLNTYFTVAAPEKRWKNLAGNHELYCAGHMFEAAVAHWRSTGRREFLDAACRFADYIASVFGPDKRHAVAGHPEIELALIRLWAATGRQRYLDLARFFIDEHGQAKTHKLYGAYCQDHKPIREQSEAVGHCVRAMYLYAAATDLAAVTGDQALKAAVERLWRDVVDRKMYVTGGIGVQGHGEGFSKAYDLPNDAAYCETCAAIGMALWNHRLFLLTGERRFADVFERVLYNGLLAGVSLDGTRFFYVNPLAGRGQHHRRPWYGCACCPTNVARFIPQIGGFLYSRAGERELRIVHYASSRVQTRLAGGDVALRVTTRYPWEERVRITIEESARRPWRLALRIPQWADEWSVHVNGVKAAAAPSRDGFVVIERAWKTGDGVGLSMAMPVRRVHADPRVTADRGRTALMRGPVVFCLEDCDHDVSVRRIVLPPDKPLTAHFEPDLLGGVMVIDGEGLVRTWDVDDAGDIHPVERRVAIRAVPYYAWDNRKPGAMVVWIPEDASILDAGAHPSLAMLAEPSASHCWTHDTVAALNDGVEPENSIDHSIPRFTWWDHRGTREWVEYRFPKPVRISETSVYWFDDTGRGNCRTPKSWTVLWHDGKTWRPVEAESAGGVEKDRYNVVKFKPVRTRRLRLDVQLRPGWSGGILEWRVR